MILHDMQEQNPYAWALSRKLAYRDILLSTRFRPESPPKAASEIVATCFYELGLYGEWENEQQKLGVMSARHVERSLRWDGVTPAYSGRGYCTITKYLAQRSGSLQDAIP
jgi:hypothetical protein